MRVFLAPLIVACLASGLSPALGAAEFAPPAGDGPLEVQVSMSVLDLSGVNDTAQTFAGNVFIRARWKDPRLAHAGAGPVARPLSEVWHPRLQVFNDAGTRSTLPNEVEVAPDGTVTHRQRLVGAFSEGLRLEDFPFDTQKFQLRLVAAGFGENVVHLVSDPEGFPIVNSSWAVSNWTLKDAKYVPADDLVPPGALRPAAIALELHMQRNVGYFLYKVILPLVLIVAMSWVVFWVAPEQAATKISVSITSMLTLIANRFMVDALVPRVSYLTRLDLFILGATVLVFVSLMLSVTSSVLANQQQGGRARALDRRCRIGIPVLFLAWALWSLVS